ncbi:MAG TPA: PDZ domain-containing protein [Nocardioides sp.]|nr:PDZ domain-containing protein [Nocardioides sp.]
MTRRTLASVVVGVLLAGLVVAAAFLPVPYVTMSPGPTVDVYAAGKDGSLISVDGARTYPTTGELRVTTVSVTSPGQDLALVDALAAWFDRTRAVYPRDVIYPPDQTAEEQRQESSVQMASSQDTAVAVALRELGYDVPVQTEVRAVSTGMPADGRLRVGDVVVEVNGARVRDVSQVARLVQRTGPDAPATFVVERKGERRTIEVVAEPAEGDPGTAVVGIEIAGSYDFPVDVDLDLDENIGGPSAGLVFALAVYDTLTPGSLSGGRHIAGTGSLDTDGRVGPIGGVEQKIVAADEAGAELFLVPPDNCAAALSARVDEDGIRLVRAPTVRSAVRSLEAFADDPDADLPECGEPRE